MLAKRLLVLLAALMTFGAAFAADYTGLEVKASTPGSRVNLDKIIADGKVLVSVFDAANKPVLGLTYTDFSVTQPGRTAQVISLLPITETIEVPRHIVLVLDNSYSMLERQATGALISGVGELMKSVRPIDDVRIVVFSNTSDLTVNNHELRVSVMKSNNPDEINAFVAKAYSTGLNASTVLYEAMMAGVEQLKDMPAGEPKFMVVFSDGEDLNAAVTAEEVTRAAGEIKGYNAYAIDYMPGSEINGFLRDFAKENGGEAWKATSETTIVEIFKKVATTFDYYYIVNYRFPPTGTVSIDPSEVTVSAVRSLDPIGKDGEAKGGLIHTAVDHSLLTLSPVVDSAHGIVEWKIFVDNANGNLATLSGEGAPAKELKVDFPIADLKALANGGDLLARMELKDSKEQQLVLTASPVRLRVAETRGGFAVTPAALKIDEVALDVSPTKDGGAAKGGLKTGIDSSELTLTPNLESKGWITRWKITVTNARGDVVNMALDGPPGAEIKVPLPTGDLDALAVGGDLAVALELLDAKNQSLNLAPQKVKVNVARTLASMGVSPAAINIDEIRTPDALQKEGGAPSGGLKATIDNSTLTLRPALNPTGWIVRWKVSVDNARGNLASATGEGAPQPEINVPLPIGDLPALGAGGDLVAKLELFDAKGQSLVLTSPPLKVNLAQTKARIVAAPEVVNIEEIKIIDSSPMLAHVYFDRESSEIPAKYVKFGSQAETAGFEEQKFRDTLEKYYQVLNIIGRRLTLEPAAKIAVVGCNDNTKEEKGKKGLSNDRAEAVRNYLLTVWGVAPERMTLEARGLPKMPSNSTTEEGQAENRRVEIVPTLPSIIAPILSTYTNVKNDTTELVLKPELVSPHGIDRWQLSLTNAGGSLMELSGSGAPEGEIKIPLNTIDRERFANGGDATVKMEFVDRKGQKVELSPATVKVNFIRRSQRMAERQDQQRVQEKYALVLFDFDKDTVGPSNQEIVNSIAARIRSLPEATVDIVGHTDNTGKAEYNLKLSGRRSLAVYKNIMTALGGGANERIRHTGVGAENPLYDNLSPEARGFNRTVTILVEYLSSE